MDINRLLKKDPLTLARKEKTGLWCLGYAHRLAEAGLIIIESHKMTKAGRAMHQRLIDSGFEPTLEEKEAMINAFLDMGYYSMPESRN